MKKRLLMIHGPMAGMTVDVDEAEEAIQNMLDTGYAEEAAPEPVVVEEPVAEKPKRVRRPAPKAEPVAEPVKPKKKAAKKKRVKRRMETPEG